MKFSTTLLPALLPLAVAMSHVHTSPQDTSTEAIIQAIREEIWANNQMQLAAFYENHRVLCPPQRMVPSAYEPSLRGDRPAVAPEVKMGIAIAVVSVFYLSWLFLLAWTVCKRAMREAESKQRQRENKDEKDE